MRFFVIILTVVLAAACLLLNLLGFNGTLTATEFFLVNAAAEVLLALLLGHFMYRTYANHRRAKKLSQEAGALQSALQVQKAETQKARKAAADAENARQAPSDRENAPSAPESATVQSAPAPEATQPMPRTASDHPADVTTLYQGPLVP